MIGDTWPAEGRVFRDEVSGRSIRQLTSAHNNVHLYFTENAFTLDGASIIFRSDRAAPADRAPHEEPHYDIFRMDLASGITTQLTAEAEPVGSVTKSPDGTLIVYIAGGAVKALDTASGAIRTIYQEAGEYTLGSPSIGAGRRYVGFARNERVPTGDHGPNYSGFKERFYAVKDARITIAMLDGSGHFDAFVDTHQLGHFQFSPDDPNIAMFCHEGPWNLVTQRIWGLDLAARRVWPCFRQEEQDSIGHEFWTHDGKIFFDNRGPDHRSQAVATHVQVNQNAIEPFVGLMDRWGTLLQRIPMPFYCNHYHAGPDNSLLVGDDVDQLVLIRTADGEPSLEPLCNHGTSWYTQASHCHPTWSWDGTRILYASDKGGRVQLYLIDL
jgi:oligogalacturonide lyase